MTRRMLLGIAAGSLALTACSRTPASERPFDAAPLHAAMHELTRVMVYDIFSPPQASRVYAYASVAAYEALRHGDSTYRSLAGQLNGLHEVPRPEGDVSLPLAGVHAMLTVGHALTFSQKRVDSLRTAYAAQYRSGMSRARHARSIEYGEQVARHVLAWAAQDRYTESRGYPKFTVTTTAGRWIPTPPAYMEAVEPNWGILRPFVMDSASQFRPAPPYPFDLTASSPFARELREVYDVGRTLSEEQRAIAAFWDCNPYVMNVRGHTMFATKKITPGGHWIGIVGLAARKAGADAIAAAEAYARTSIALADAFISSWEEKYRSALVRPETVINQTIDEEWTPLLQTPPFPEYTSGHSVISTAAAVVLTRQFGDAFAFSDSTEVEYGLPVREFMSFEQAAAEAAISRLYGGIHYRRAIEQGVIQGRQVGQLVAERVQTRVQSQMIVGER